MTNEKLKQIFDENADCYFTMEMQSAMTESKFIEVVSELMQPTDTWIEIKSEDDLPKDRGINDTWVIDKNGFMEVLSSNALKWVYSRNHWVNYYTHYLPIHKPNPPK